MIKSPHHHKSIEVGGPPLSESEFSFALARVAVAQICHSGGFKGAQNSALEALTDIATRYLKAIAKLGAASANSNGRTESNLPDTIIALEDLASIQGFPSSLRSHSLYTSAVIKNLMKFVKYADEIPFAQPLPLPPREIFFKGAKGKHLKYEGGGDNCRWYCDEENSRHVARWLPAMPVVEGKEKGEEKKREVKWGCLDGRVEREEENRRCDERKMVEREGNKEIEMLGKRGKVRFKMGVALGDVGMVRNLRCGGIGKRVVCSGDEENESKRMKLAPRKKPR